MANRYRTKELGSSPRPARLGRGVAAAAAVGLLWCADAWGLSILSIRDFNQSAGFGYTLLNSETSTAAGRSRQTEQEFTEDYGVTFSYHILTPQLLRGTALLDLQWRQHAIDTDRREQEDQNFHLRYDVVGRLLGSSPLTVAYDAGSTRETISQSFAPSYQNDLDKLGARVSIRNQYVPVECAVARENQTTSGLNQNFRQSVDTFSLTATPTLGRLGSLSLSTTTSHGETAALDNGLSSVTNSASGRASYQGAWKSDRGLSRNFTLGYGYQGTEGTQRISSNNVNGNLYWQLGEALDATLSYQRGSNKSNDAIMDNQGGRVALSHQLFGSITTGVNFSAFEESADAAENRTYVGGASIRYHNRLPRKGSVEVGYSYNQGVTERTGTVAQLPTTEQHPLPAAFPRLIPLLHPTYLISSVVVIGSPSNITYPASFFTVDPEGIRIDDFVPGDTTVSITYNFRQDPNVTTSSVSHAASAAVSFLDGKYQVHADASLTEQHLEKGVATSLSLADNKHLGLGAAAHLGAHTLNTETGYDKNYAQDEYYLSGAWNYTAPFYRGQITLNTVDRYTWLSAPAGSGRSDSRTNSLNLEGEYSGRFGFVLARLKGDYANVVTTGAVTHTADLALNLEGQFGRFSALLTSNASWSFSDRGDSSIQGVGFAIRRTF